MSLEFFLLRSQLCRQAPRAVRGARVARFAESAEQRRRRVGRKLFCEQIDATRLWKVYFEPLGIQLHGITMPFGAHVFKMVRRSDVFEEGADGLVWSSAEASGASRLRSTLGTQSSW